MHETNAQFILIAALTFIIAGGVKGVIGMGLPTVAIGLLGLFMAPGQAAALLIIPSLVTNVWQFVAGPHRLLLLRRMRWMLLAICIVTWAAAGLIAGGSAGRADTALGITLVVYSIIGFGKVQLSVSRRIEPWLSPLVGALTGLVTGATGVLVIPAGVYLHALGLEKEDLVQALGLSFITSTIALAAGLASRGAFHISAAGVSALCTVPALAGMSLGSWIRVRVNPATFHRLFLIVLCLLGSGLIFRSAIV